VGWRRSNEVRIRRVCLPDGVPYVRIADRLIDWHQLIPSKFMKRKSLRGSITFIICCTVVSFGSGCGTFRWGERTTDDWDEITKDQAWESHYWADFKKRGLQNPRWTP
jgi:hypothetical protein